MIDLAVRAEIDELYADYVDVLDNGEIERWPDLFTDVCTYKIVSRENVERSLPVALMWCDGKAMLNDRVHAYAKLVTYTPRALRHVISSLRVRADGDAFRVGANYAVFETRIDESSRVFNVGRYQDVVVRDGERLKYREKICIYDTVIIDNAVVAPV
ncbi:MAG TPA: nuclear transport factor 2 family protein [Candidatus Lustribacter sp.]